MSRKTIGLLFAVGLLAIPRSGFAADKAIHLMPVTPWQVEWEPHSCRASRGFGDKDQPSLIVIERFGPTQRFNALVVGKELLSLEWAPKVTVSFGNGHSYVIEKPVLGVAKDRRSTLFINGASLVRQPTEGIGLVPTELERASDRISLALRSKTVIFETGPLEKMFAEIRRCTEDMFRVWKLDKDEQYSLKEQVTPTASPGTWVTTNDYPAKQLDQGDQAILSFTLVVDADGTPAECVIPRSYGDEAFRTLTCSLLMQRARFKPARNAQGQAVRSVYFGNVRWVTPDWGP